MRDQSTVGQNSQGSGRKYWTTRSSVHLFARTARSFACTALLASLACSAALIRLIARSLTHSRAREKVIDSMSQNDLVLSHSAEGNVAKKASLGFFTV